MPLPDVPENLSRQTVADFVGVLRRSEREWGAATARRAGERLLLRFRHIAEGSAAGHRRDDVKPRTPALFVRETPWVIAYNPETRQVFRVLYGARHFPAAFPKRS